MVANVLFVELFFAEDDFEHSDDSCELKVIESFFERLILVNNGDVADFIALMEALDPVLDQFSKFYRALDSI